MVPILNKSLPKAPWLDPAAWRLPGTQPLDPAQWLYVDDVFSEQMALRDMLLSERCEDVHAIRDEAEAAAREVLDHLLSALRSNPTYRIRQDEVLRPDGVSVAIDRTQPLRTAGRLVQEDLCLLQPDSTQTYHLSAAVLCFPASWTLSEKIGKTLVGLHNPIDAYSDDIARRVQRLFESIRPGMMLARSNALLYNTPMLHAPRREAEHDADGGPDGRYLRSERQALQRLPQTKAVLFSIHTFVVRVEDLTREQAVALDQVRARLRPR